MNYGMYLSAAGALAGIHRQAVLSNNLANVDTVGFKPDLVALRQRETAYVESGSTIAADPRGAREMLEQLSGGTLADFTTPSQRQGALRRTGGALDIAVVGQGFLVMAGSADAPGDVRLTRDGRMTIAPDGTLVSATTGRAVLGDDGMPIRLDPAQQVEIAADGSIRQGDVVAGRLALRAMRPGDRIAREGDGHFRLETGAVLALPRAEARIEQWHVESSAVDPIRTMVELFDAARQAQSGLQLMQYHDQMLGQTFGAFARVS